MGKIYGVVKVFRTGGSLVVSIPTEATRELGISEGDNFLVAIEDKGLTYSKRETE